MKIVITGGIGSGKSSVTKMLGEMLPTFAIVSVDKLVEKMYDDPAISDALIERLGTSNKKDISDIVFRNQKLRNSVESLFSTQINLSIAKAIELNPDLIIEFPLLFEKAKDRIGEFDIVISVSAYQASRMQRVMKRNGFSREKVQSIMDAQVEDEDRVEDSTFIIDNNSDFSSLEYQVREIADLIKLKIAKEQGKKIGIVSGSYDPITLGHQYIIKSALSIVDLVVVGVANNSGKKYFLTKYERMQLVSDSLGESLTDVEFSRVVLKFVPEDEFTVNYARAIGAKFLFRGLRNSVDLDYENQINLLQKKIAPEIETIYLITPRELIEISSSLVKSTLSCNRWEEVAASYVSRSVLKYMKSIVNNSEE